MVTTQRAFVTVTSTVVVFIGVYWAFGGFNRGSSKVSPTSKTKSPAAKMAKSKIVEFDFHDSPLPGKKFFTDEEIAYKPGVIPHLVIVGHVFDVTNGFKSYEPGTGYHGFIGQDGSRAFVSGEFNKEGLISDLDGLSTGDFSGLADWVKFYIKTYPFLGYHVGRFFTADGKVTAAYQHFLEMQDVAKNDAAARQSVTNEFPPCNVEWSEASGTNVWCSEKSGGVDRSWTGFPVLFKESADKDPRCACVQESQLKDPRISRYKGCAGTSSRCDKISTN